MVGRGEWGIMQAPLVWFLELGNINLITITSDITSCDFLTTYIKTTEFLTNDFLTTDLKKNSKKFF